MVVDLPSPGPALQGEIGSLPDLPIEFNIGRKKSIWLLIGRVASALWRAQCFWNDAQDWTRADFRRSSIVFTLVSRYSMKNARPMPDDRPNRISRVRLKQLCGTRDNLAARQTCFTGRRTRHSHFQWFGVERVSNDVAQRLLF